jgi:hypothetical protein
LPRVGSTIHYDPALFDNEDFDVPIAEFVDEPPATVPPIVLTGQYDITPPPTHVAAGDDEAARAYLEAGDNVGVVPSHDRQPYNHPPIAQRYLDAIGGNDVRVSASVSIRRDGVITLGTVTEENLGQRVYVPRVPGSIAQRYIDAISQPNVADSSQDGMAADTQNLEPRDWEIRALSNPTQRVYEDELDVEACNMSSSMAYHGYEHLDDELLETNPIDVMYQMNPDYPPPRYWGMDKIVEGYKFQAQNDAYTFCRLSTSVNIGRPPERYKEELSERKHLSRATNAAWHNYKKIYTTYESMAKHLNSLNEQFFSVKDWIAAVFRIVESDRMSEQRISDEYAHPLPANFVPTAKQDTSASTSTEPRTNVGNVTGTPAPTRKQQHRFCKGAGRPTPEGFVRHKHVNFSPTLTQEGLLEGAIEDDDMDGDAGDEERDVLLSAEKHEAEIIRERSKRKARVAGKTHHLEGDDESSVDSAWRPSQDGLATDEEEDDDASSSFASDDDDTVQLDEAQHALA